MKRKRCLNGTRKNRKTGICEPIKNKAEAKIEAKPETKPEAKSVTPPEAKPETQSSSIIPSFVSSIMSMISPQTQPAQDQAQAKPETPSETNTKKQAKRTTRKNQKRSKTPQIETENQQGEDITTELQDEIEVESDIQELNKTSITEESIDSTDSSKTVDSVEHVDKNKEKFALEKKEYDDYKQNPEENNFLYPDQNDPNFNIHIAKKKLFQDTKYDGTIYDDIEAQSKKECAMDFEIMPHQQFVRNFMSADTPYNSLLLFHELGTGKTYSAIGITEETRQYMKRTGNHKKIIIIAYPNVRDNFRNQLFDPNRLEEVGNKTGAWTINTDVGNSLIKEVTTSQNQPLTKEQITRRIQSVIRDNYVFMGYDEFAILMKNIGDVEPILATDTPEVQMNKQQKIDMIRREFDDSLIVIDEVHNIIGENKKKKKTSNMIVRLVRMCKNIRFLFLSATPMYNSHKEIVWLTNLMNLNDGRPTISTNQVFKENGDFVEEKKDTDGNVLQEDGKELLKRKLIGYVSYVRGENPYAFPFRIYPTLFAEKEHLLSQKTYPTVQMNKKTIQSSIEFLDVYVSTMSEYQTKAYKAITHELNKDKQFKAMEYFGYTWLQTPLSILNMTYPSEDLDTHIETNEPLDKYSISRCHGIQGLNETMNFKDEEDSLYDFEYKDHVLEKHGRFFEIDKIQKYSVKIHEICKSIQNSTGIVLIYSKYIQGGLIPMALALEEMGFTRFGKAKPFFKQDDENKKPLLDPLTMKPKTSKSMYTAKYLMITGQKKVSPNNKFDLKTVVDSSNFDGKLVKVVLISEAGSEGLDFKNIRQVHILDPWYNMNRIEQIIGRAVRNRSHCKLPFEKRNVEIYLHSTYINDVEESADMYMYRLAEKKAKSIGQITRTLKETAVDCLLNIEQQNFSQDKLNKVIKLTLSTNEKVIDYQVGDKPYSKNCDYMDKCEYQCSPSLDEELTEDKITKETYNSTYLQNNHTIISKRLRQLYKNNVQYSLDELLKEIQILKPYPIEQIYYSLTMFLKNKNEWLIDKNGRRGYLLLKNDVYVFQPAAISDTEASIYERTQVVDIKTKQVNINLPEANQVPIIPDDDKILKITKNDPPTTANNQPISNDVVEVNTENRKVVDPNIESKVTTLLNSMDKKLKLILRSEYNNTTDKDWFLNSNLSFQLLIHTHKVPAENVLLYFFHHILDTMLHDDKLACLQYYFHEKADFVLNFDVKKDLTTDISKINKTNIIKHYFLMRMNTDYLQSSNKVYAIIPIERKNILYTWNENDLSWNLASVVEQENEVIQAWIQQRFNKQEKLLERLNKEATNLTESNFGFMDILKKTESDGYGFKIKNILQKKNNLGARCNEADKQSLITKVNSFLEIVGRTNDVYEKEPVFDTQKNLLTSKSNAIANFTAKKISKKAAMNLKIEPVERIHLCIVYEILMRHHTQQDDTIYFFSLEESNTSHTTSLAVDMNSDGRKNTFYYIKK